MDCHYLHPDQRVEYYDSLIQTEPASLVTKDRPYYQTESQDAGNQGIDKNVFPIRRALEAG